jgi:hypothetical protein
MYGAGEIAAGLGSKGSARVGLGSDADEHPPASAIVETARMSDRRMEASRRGRLHRKHALRTHVPMATAQGARLLPGDRATVMSDYAIATLRSE